MLWPAADVAVAVMWARACQLAFTRSHTAHTPTVAWRHTTPPRGRGLAREAGLPVLGETAAVLA